MYKLGLENLLDWNVNICKKWTTLVNDFFKDSSWPEPSFFFSSQNLKRQDSCTYRNDPKFSDRYAWAADPGQTAPDQRLHCLPFRLHRLDSVLYHRAT